MEVAEKLEREQKRLDKLLEQKGKIDEKIGKCKSEIQKYDALLHQKKFNEAEEVLKIKGISMDDVLAAIRNGDVTALQGRLDGATEKPITGGA